MDARVLKHRKTRRTTLTLEADVADYIEEKLAEDKRLKEKNLVNHLLRKGIAVDSSSADLEPFVIEPFKTKLAPGVTLDDLEEMIREI